MSAKRVLMAVVVASAVMLAVGIGPRLAGTAQARPPIPESAPQGMTIPYAGRLDDEGGQPVEDGAYDFTFALYAAPDGGEALWSEVQEGVAVEGGAFATLLGSVSPIPPAVLDGSTGLTASGAERWLAVGVRGPGERDFTALTPRQRLSSGASAGSVGPAAGPACEHDHWGESWTGSGTGLILSSGTAAGVEGETNSTSGYVSGVIGRVTSTGPGSWSAGVRGINNGTAASGIGVYGSQEGSGWGVYGTTPNGRGVYGHAWDNSGQNYGVFGSTASVSGTGVYGEATASFGAAHGVHGKTNSPKGRGVYGEATNGLGDNYGVYGITNSSSGRGVYGKAAHSSGTLAIGVYGETASSGGYGVYGYATNSSGGYGVYGKTDGSGYGGWFEGPVHVNGTLSKSGGTFKIDHPLDPENKYLYHSFVESPDMKNVYDGVVALDANGEAWVQLPEWFEALNRDFRYQLTCIGGFAPVYIAQEIAGNRFQIAGGTSGMKVSWQVTGIRQDAYAEANRVPVEEEKPREEQGTYLHPTEHGQPKTMGLDYQRDRDRRADGGGP